MKSKVLKSCKGNSFLKKNQVPNSLKIRYASVYILAIFGAPNAIENNRLGMRKFNNYTHKQKIVN